jgi:hypothetical protein
MAFGEERENYVYIAKLAEQAERYDGLIVCFFFFSFFFSCIFSLSKLVL